MLSAVYQLKSPRRFELSYVNIDVNKGVVVRPTHLSVCHADQRYYQGKRPKEILKEKLPMALIHEGVGEVVKDNTDTFKIGQKVCMIPNAPSEQDEIIKENYLRSSRFRASGMDGFMQEYICFKPDRLVLLPDDINLAVASFTELVSVSYHAITRFTEVSHKRRNTVGFWGDGNLSFLTALVFHYLFPEVKIIIFGKHEIKLSDFTFADETYAVNNIPDNLRVDHAFECVGGDVSADVINQIIDYINPQGSISILGVSENLAPLNTRMILEKGLTIIGSSRSGREDYLGLMKLYEDNPNMLAYLETLIGNEVKVSNIGEIVSAFEQDISQLSGKTVMYWNC